jgi:hypothetical protein
VSQPPRLLVCPTLVQNVARKWWMPGHLVVVKAVAVRGAPVGMGPGLGCAAPKGLAARGNHSGTGSARRLAEDLRYWYLTPMTLLRRSQG